MTEASLVDLRAQVKSLASPDGEYSLVCARTGGRPIPATGLRFESRRVARMAARSTERYRAALRRYDPQVPHHDVIVQQSPAIPRASARSAPPEDSAENRDRNPPEAGDSALIEFCHAVAVFETIAASEHNAVEDAIMETYFDLAETVEHPDELCLRLLESIAIELDDRLNPAAQAAVLSTAVNSLPTDAPAETDGDGDPLEGALARLRTSGLLADYRIERCSADLDTGARSWEVRIDGYALGEADGRIVTLPIVVELLGRLAARSVRITGAERVDGTATWRFAVATGEEAPSGLACLSDGSGR
ncbi:MAG: hypothetical protein QXG03_04820 [Halalkalicoccus sp.]